jgi:hypothetical protein
MVRACGNPFMCCWKERKALHCLKLSYKKTRIFKEIWFGCNEWMYGCFSLLSYFHRCCITIESVLQSTVVQFGNKLPIFWNRNFYFHIHKACSIHSTPSHCFTKICFNTSGKCYLPRSCISQNVACTSDVPRVCFMSRPPHQFSVNPTH